MGRAMVSSVRAKGEHDSLNISQIATCIHSR
jgi:hypothetical protein